MGMARLCPKAIHNIKFTATPKPRVQHHYKLNLNGIDDLKAKGYRKAKK
jgi:hypothetical protein